MTPADLERFVELDPAARTLLLTAAEKLALSARGHDRLLRVARTIADLDGCGGVGAEHVAEAVQYRRREPASGSPRGRRG